MPRNNMASHCVNNSVIAKVFDDQNRHMYITGFILFLFENGFVTLFFSKRNYSLKHLPSDRIELPSKYQSYFPLSRH